LPSGETATDVALLVTVGIDTVSGERGHLFVAVSIRHEPRRHGRGRRPEDGDVTSAPHGMLATIGAVPSTTWTTPMLIITYCLASPQDFTGVPDLNRADDQSVAVSMTEMSSTRRLTRGARAIPVMATWPGLAPAFGTDPATG
jgi:hypothetical protein